MYICIPVFKICYMYRTPIGFVAAQQSTTYASNPMDMYVC